MKSIFNNKVEIVCPKCSKITTAEFAHRGCDCIEEYANKKYTLQAISVMSAIIIGGVSGAIFDGYTNIYRASVKTEYKMMKTCIKEHSYNDGTHDEKIRDQCVCAVEQLSGLLDAERARFYGDAKLSEMLDTAYQDCK